MSEIRMTYEYIRKTYAYILFFPLLPGMLIGADERVGFRQAIVDDEYASFYLGSKVKHRTP